MSFTSTLKSFFGGIYNFFVSRGFKKIALLGGSAAAYFLFSGDVANNIASGLLGAFIIYNWTPLTGAFSKKKPAVDDSTKK
ncbi:MAG: hypothetical protein ACSLE0_23450 [Chitinophagaceae bacterium]